MTAKVLRVPALTVARALCLFAALAVVAAVTFPARSSRAAERVMVIIEETIGDARAGTSLAEIRLSERLITAGQQVVEAVETDKARSTISVERLLGGSVGAEVTALNCDVLLVGRTATVAEDIPYGVTDMAAVSTEWTVRAIGVDTGRVLASASGRTAGAGTQAQAAGGDARKKAADQMFDAVTKVFGSDNAPAEAVSLTVSGVQEIKNVEVIRAALAKIDGVRKVTVRFVSADETRIDVDVSGDTWTFAGNLRAIGLEVAQLSRGAVRATWSPWGAGKKLAIAAFQNRTGVDRDDWIEAMLPEVFATELANSRYLRAAAASAPAAPGTPGTPATPGTPRVALDEDDAAAVGKAVKSADADMIAIGVLEPAGAQLRLSVAVYGPDGKQVTAAQVFVAEPDLVSKTRDLVWALDARLFEKLFAKASLTPYQSAFVAKSASAPGAPGPGTSPVIPIDPSHGTSHGTSPLVKVVEVKLDDIFPSRLAAYASHPIGKVVLTNASTVAATGVRVRVDLPGITSAPAILRVDDIAPGAQREVPVTLVLDRDKVMAITENRPVQAEIALSWDAADKASDVFTVPVVVFDKNALDWSVPESIAAFTTHKDTNLDAFARAAERQAHAALGAVPDALKTPLYLFEALGATGITYQADSRNPFGATRLDAVAFPSETLARKAGDCDDLSVLMAALLESQGADVSFVLTPGHILVAWDSGLATRDAGKLGLPPTAILDRGGRAWIPLEATRVGDAFSDAVMAGAAEIERHKDSPDGVKYVEVADAWKTWPPFPGTFGKLDAPSLAAFGDRVAGSVKQLGALANALSTFPDSDRIDDPDEANRAGVQLVQHGQWRRARPYLERAHALAPKRQDIEYNLANLHLVEGNKPEARATYQQLQSTPNLTGASLHGLGVLAYLDGSTQDARSYFERAGIPEAKDALQRLGLASPPKPRAPKPGVKKAVAPPPDPFLGIRAGIQRVPLDELLVWLH